MSTSRHCRALAALAGATVLTVGAGLAYAETGPPGDVPDNQAFVAFRGAGYSLRVPEGWPRTLRASRVTFSDTYNSISVDVSKAARRPTAGSVAKTELRELRSTTKGFAQPKVTTVKRKAGVAVLITYRAMSATSAVTGKAVVDDVERYEFWRAGTLAALTLQAPRGSDNVDPWKLVTDSFAWTR